MAKKIKKVKMSVPEGYDMNTTYHPLYYDFERNTDSNRDSFSDKLDIEIQTISDLLKSKNKAYGNTALKPTNIFSKLNATEAICARIDDKLARISNKGINDQTEDTVDDLIGYLLLLKMSLE
tara:strand:+ start:1837 stop:2202 length:366 start_codon:yes stop_codon:yes gene_type:complete